MRSITLLCALAATSAASAQPRTLDFDDLAEGFHGETFTYNGVTFSEVNGIGGVFPDGSTFDPDYPGEEVIIENATLFYNDYPTWGSANNALTFGGAYIVGDNLSLGAVSRVTMTLDGLHDAVWFDMAYYENGPWQGIVYTLDAYLGGSLVASQNHTIAGSGDLTSRDNIALHTFALDGAQFDSLQFTATFNGQPSAPRILIDDLTLNAVPAPGAAAVMGVAGFAALRRRR